MSKQKSTKNPKYEIVNQIETKDSIENAEITNLASSFEPYFQKAQSWKKEAEEIKVTDESQADLIVKARQLRLKLKQVRVDAGKVKKQLKEDVLLKGRAIDGMYNVIKYLINPTEKHLENQEKFVERKREEKLDKLEQSRVDEMSEYVEDVSAWNLREMTEEAYKALLVSQKKMYEIRKEKEEKEAEERRRNDIIIDIEQKILDWNLPVEFQDKKKLLASKNFDKEIAEFNEVVSNQISQIKEQNEQLRKEKEEREKKEAEEKAEKERKEKERLEAERKAKLAPDKDKLTSLANTFLSIDYPEVESEEAKKLLAGVKELAKKVNIYIINNIGNL